jgi:peptidoglycan/xylan/chitin deacetylase (PgdA/CDA1 family)
VSARFAAATVAKKAVKLALLGPAIARRTAEPGLVVLIYHRVGAGMGREMDVPLAMFRRQMEWLSADASVVGLREGLERLDEGPSGDLVAITFDDGYRDVYRRAWPVLRDLQLPVTLFLATAFLEGERQAPIRAGAAGPGHEVEPLRWDEVGEMTGTGLVEVGSHGHTHREFDRLSPAEVEEECERSNSVLRERAGVKAEAFAYPRGVVGNEEVVARRYRWGLAAGGAKIVPGAPAHRLSRTPVRASDGVFFFRRRLAGIAPLEDRLYDRLRRSPGRRA